MKYNWEMLFWIANDLLNYLTIYWNIYRTIRSDTRNIHNELEHGWNIRFPNKLDSFYPPFFLPWWRREAGRVKSTTENHCNLIWRDKSLEVLLRRAGNVFGMIFSIFFQRDWLIHPFHHRCIQWENRCEAWYFVYTCRIMKVDGFNFFVTEQIARFIHKNKYKVYLITTLFICQSLIMMLLFILHHSVI